MSKRRMNPIEISINQFKDGQIHSQKVCTVIWDSQNTPLIVAKELGHEHYHHYFEKGKLVAHIRNNKTKEKCDSKQGISNSISKIISKFHKNGIK